MPDTPTPGQVYYAAYYHTILRLRPARVLLRWHDLSAEDQHAWEAAAQAVQPPPQQPPVCAHCQMPYTWKCSCDCEEDDHV